MASDSDIITLLDELESLPDEATRRREIAAALKRMATHHLRDGTPMPEPLAWWLALKLEDSDADSLLAGSDPLKLDPRTLATPDVARVFAMFSEMSLKELKKFQHSQTPEEATMAFFEIEKDTLRKANHRYGVYARAEHEGDYSGVDKRLLRQRAYYRFAHNNPLSRDVAEAVELVDGNIAILLKTGDFEVRTPDDAIIFRSYRPAPLPEDDAPDL